MIRVSVIVPVYNMEKYLDKCLTSLVNQTLDDIEVIVINDGSTDNSQTIIEKYQKKYSKIIRSFKNKNQGISKTRNFGITKAKGEYIAFIDSDDFVELNMLEKMYNEANRKNLDVVVCDYYNYYENTGSVAKQKIEDFGITSIIDRPDLIFKINSSPWNKIYKRDLILNNSYRFPDNIKYEDLGYIPILLNEAKRIGKINFSFNYYLIRGNSETTTIDNRVYDIFKILNILYDYYKLKDMETKKEVEYLFINKLTTYNLQQKFNTDSKSKKTFVKDSFKYLDNLFPNWKKNKYLNEQSKLKYIVKTNKLLTNIYINLGGTHEN